MMAQQQPRAAIWDMDGTLIDSGEYHWLAWQAQMQREHAPLSYEQFIETFGQRNDTILRGWLGADLTDAEMARISDAKEALYRQILADRGIDLLPGNRAWLTRLREQGWRQAIASAAPRANIEAIIYVLDLDGMFDAIVAAEDVQRGKPDPQVFLLAAERLGVAPERAVVIEDAPAGVEGARRAGMHVIGVGPKYRGLPADYALASLEDLPPDAFDRLIASGAARAG
jgi:beta-phosphoglucomutase family hydrolase